MSSCRIHIAFPAAANGSESLWRNGLGGAELGHRTLDVGRAARQIARRVAAAKGADSREQAKAASRITSARFALQMIEGTPRVRFRVRSGPG